MIESTTENTIVKKRFGFYPCDFETFKKIKALRKEYFKAQVKAAQWYRWARKSKKNRIGEEPVFSNIFCTLIKIEEQPYIESPDYSNFYRSINSSWIDKEHRIYAYVIHNNSDKTIIINDLRILENYEIARMPVKDIKDIRNITISKEEIDAMFEDIC